MAVTVVVGALASAGAAEAAGGTSQGYQWPTTVAAASSPAGAATFTFGSSGVTGTLTNAAEGCGYGINPATNADLRTFNAAAYYAPTLPTDAVGLAQCQVNAAPTVRTLTFSQPLLDPSFYIDDLDASYLDFSAAPSGGAVTLHAVDTDPNLQLLNSGTELKDIYSGGTEPCAQTPLAPGNDPGCGTFSMTQAGGPVSGFTMTNTVKTAGAGDGWYWTFAFPTASLTKAFSPGTVTPGSTSKLTFTIDNPSATALGPMGFTDSFSAGLKLADATTSDNGNCGSESLTDASGGALGTGSTSVKVAGLSVAAGTTCTITVDVSAAQNGNYTDDNTNLTTTVGNLVPNSSTTLTVVASELSAFDKLGTDPTTGSTATANGTPGTTATGDVLNWVLSYDNTSGSAANANITDPITGNQSYVNGSLVTPPGLSPQYSTNGGSSWTSGTPPANANGVGATGTVGSTLSSLSATSSPFSSGTVSFSTSGGDGYSVEGLGNNVYTVFHHNASATSLFCATLSNAVCPGWPGYSTYASITAGLPLGTGPGGYVTAGINGSFIADGNLYYEVEEITAVGGQYPVGEMCVNLTSATSCGFIKLDTIPFFGGTGAAISADGIQASDGNYYMFDEAGNMLCFAPSASGGSGCGVVSVDGTHPSGDANYLGEFMTVGQYVYATYEQQVSGYVNVTCYNVTTKALCAAGFPFTDGPPADPGFPDNLAPALDTSGNLLAGCDMYYGKCYTPSGTLLAHDPWTVTQGYGYPGVPEGFGTAAIVGTKVYFGFNDTLYCFDFAQWDGTSRVPTCTGFTGQTDLRNYTVRALANLPGCMAADGDGAQILVFDATTGGTCVTASTKLSLTPANYYCDGQSGHVKTWGKLQLDGLTGSEYAAAVVTLVGANGPVPGFTDLTLAAGQTQLDLSSLPVSGNTATLTLQVTLVGVSSTTKVNAATISTSWVGDPMQVCFKTKVGPGQCATTQSITNNANAVTSVTGLGTDGPGGVSTGAARFTEQQDTSKCVDLGIDKSATPQADPGGPITYTFTVTNHGPGDSTGYKISDTLPAGVTHAATTSPGCSVSGSTVSCTEGALADNGTATFTVTADAPSPFPSAITNTATVTGNETDPNQTNNTSSATTTPNNPTVSLTKYGLVTPAADQSSLQVGDLIAYSYKVTNTGNVVLKTVAVSDPTVGAVMCPTPDSPGLGVGASETCNATVEHVVTQADVDAGKVTDTATATGTDPGGQISPTSNPSTVTIPATPALPSDSIQKIAHASGGDTTPIKVGETISYTYVVTNTGNVDLKTVSVSDQTVGSVTCPAPGAPGLAPGASETCTADHTHTVTQADVDSGGVTDTATSSCVDTLGTDCPTSPPSEKKVPSQPDPVVSLKKTGTVSPAADQQGYKVGDTISYSYLVTNTGNVTLATVSVSDSTIGTVTCPTPASPGLAPGASETCTADHTHTVTQADVDAGSLSDTATAGCTDTQSNSCSPSNPSTVTLPATPAAPAVALVKSGTVTPSGDQSAVQVGDTIAYSYKITNTGNVTLKTVAPNDPSAGTIDCPAIASPGLAPGASITCTAATPHTVTQEDVDDGQVVDTATAGCTDVDGNPCPTSPPSKVTIPAVTPSPTVSIKKTGTVAPAADQGGVQVGDKIFYTYEVTNTGNVTILSVSVSDPTVGPVTCPLAADAPGLAPGGTVKCFAQFPHIVTQADVDAGAVTDTATAGCTAVQGDTCPTSPPSKVTIPAVPEIEADSVQKIADASGGDTTAIFDGETINYSYLVTNTGNVDLASISVSDATAGTVTCPTLAPPGLPPGRSVTCHADSTYTVSQTDVNGGSITDTATAGCKDTAGNPCTTSPPSMVTVPGNPTPSVSIDKSAVVDPAGDQNAIAVGDQVSYSYVVTNTGNVSLPTVSVNDPSIGKVTCPAPAAPGLAPGAAVTCTADALHTVTQTDVDAGGVTDTATAGCVDTLGDNCTPSLPSTATVPSVPAPLVSLVKTGTVSPSADQDGVKAGDTITYTYRVTNIGNVDLKTLSVDDPTVGGVSCPATSAPGLAPGQSETCTADSAYTVTQADVDAGHVSDTATATGTDNKNTTSPPSNPSTVTIPATPPAPSVSVVKSGTVTPTGDQSDIKVGDTIAYSYVVTNTGNVTLGTVSVSDPSIGTVNCPTPGAPGLAPGASITCTAATPHVVDQTDVDNAHAKNVATAGCIDTKGVVCPVSPPSIVTVPADPSPTVTVRKSATVAPAADQQAAKLGDTIAYSYVVTNTGNVDLTFVRVSDPSLGAVTCPIPAPPGLAPGKSETCTGDVQHVVGPADVAAGKVADTATATGIDPQGKTSPTSPPSDAVVKVPQTVSNVAITKTVNRAAAYPGEQLTYTITVTNHGPAQAHDTVVTDHPTLPMKVLRIHSTVGSCKSGATITCTLGTLSVGETVKITITAVITHAGTEHNQATVTFAGHNPKRSVAGVSARIMPTLLLTKVPSTHRAKAGRTVSYKLRVRNPSSVTIAKVTVCDRLPARLLYVGSRPAAHLSTGRYCWSVARLAPHASRTFTIKVDVAPGANGAQTNDATATAPHTRGATATSTITVYTPPRRGCPSAADTGGGAGPAAGSGSSAPAGGSSGASATSARGTTTAGLPRTGPPSAHAAC